MSFSGNCGNNVCKNRGFRQETAQNGLSANARYTDRQGVGKVGSAGGCSSKLPTALCQHRYPSPCRFVPTQNGPASLFQARQSAALRRGGEKQLVTGRSRVIFRGVEPSNKGNETCLRKQQSSHLQRSWVWAHVQASTPMVSARWLAPLAAHWRQAPRATTPRRAHWRVLPQARFATTSTSAAKASDRGRANRSDGPFPRLGLAPGAIPCDTRAYCFSVRGNASCATSQHSSSLPVSRPAPLRLSHRRPHRLNPWSSQWSTRLPWLISFAKTVSARPRATDARRTAHNTSAIYAAASGLSGAAALSF